VNNWQKSWLFFLVAFSLLACSSSIKDYQNSEPEFDLKTFFTGELVGWGLIKNYEDKVTKRFTVEMTGTWQNNKGKLYELFTYADGTLQERTWYLTTHADGLSSGTASDVLGAAAGEQRGFAFNWNYDLLFESDNQEIQVHLNDWIYQIDKNAVISQATIKKFGLEVGEVIVFILKQDENS
jgi:hypothetical protein